MTAFRMPIAKMHTVYSVDEVEKKLTKLKNKGSEQEHRNLASTYERMLELGPERFCVKPARLPEMDDLYEWLPNFTEALDDIRRSLALSQRSEDPLELTPMLLLGPPGVGKTHFASQIADLLGTGMTLVPMGSMTAGWILSGSSSQWKGSKSGKVFDSLVEGQYANPVILVDEIDKSSSNAQYDPMGPLYSLLEHDTAKFFHDEFADVALNTCQVHWFMTANDDRNIPEPILNRVNVYQIKPPSAEASRKIAKRMYRSILEDHGWGQTFTSEPLDDVLDHFVGMPPREMRRGWMTGLGNACLRNGGEVTLDDLPKAEKGKNRIGF